MKDIDSKFVIEFDRVQGEAFLINCANGWWSDRADIAEACITSGVDHNPHLAIELIGLIHTELSEAVEAARKHPIQSWSDYKTKDTMVRELAGCVVRIMDMAENFGLPVGRAIEAEIESNRGRGHMHGGKKA